MHSSLFCAFILSAANGRVLWAAAFETEGRCGGPVVIAKLPFQQPLLCLERDGKGFWQLFRLYGLLERPLCLASEDNICHSSSTSRQWVQRRCIDSECKCALLAGPVTGESLPNIVIGRILNNAFYFQSCREGIIIFKKPGFIIQFLKTATLLTVKQEIVLKSHNLIKHFLLSTTGLMAYIFFFFHLKLT